MARLPVVSGREAVRAFTKAGRMEKRREGNHMILGKPRVPVVLSIPNHKELDKGLLRGQIRKAGLTVEEFVKLLKL